MESCASRQNKVLPPVDGFKIKATGVYKCIQCPLGFPNRHAAEHHRRVHTVPCVLQVAYSLSDPTAQLTLDSTVKQFTGKNSKKLIPIAILPLPSNIKGKDVPVYKKNKSFDPERTEYSKRTRKHRIRKKVIKSSYIYKCQKCNKKFTSKFEYLAHCVSHKL